MTPFKKVLALIKANDGINHKARLTEVVVDALGLTKDGKVYYCADFAIRFSESKTKGKSKSNTVLGLSRLQKYDDRPFVVCLVAKDANHCCLANTTFLKKVSHSSQELQSNNIRGSFNYSDIVKQFDGIENAPANFERLFPIHEAIGFEGNLGRLVEATNNISPTGVKFVVNDSAGAAILAAPERASRFIESSDASVLKAELDEIVNKFMSEILLAALIEPPKVRGMVIEHCCKHEFHG